MLYYLFDYLNELDLPGAGIFKYVSFRSALALIFSLLISTIIGSRMIRMLQKMQIGEVVRDLGLEGQMQKKGTPTMGGIIIIVSLLVPTLFLAKLDNVYIILMIITTVWLGILGFVDDYIKVFKKDKAGIHGKSKIIAQVGLGLIVGLTMYLSPDIIVKENLEVLGANDVIEQVTYTSESVKSTQTTIPFVKNNNLDYDP